MRDQILVDRHRLQTLEREVQELSAKLADAFSAEEMDAIREQLAARVAEAETAREELEWNLRVELARVREVEQSCIRAAHEMREVAGSLARLLGEEDTIVTAVRPLGRRRMFA
jgi:hypothetical protein